MRKILISTEIIELSEKYSSELFAKRNSTFEKPINNDSKSGKLFDLKKHLRDDCRLSSYADYVNNIIDKYKDINKLLPSQYDYYKRNFFNLCDSDLSKKIPSNGNQNYETKELYKLIVDAMRYDAVRDKEFLPYIKKLGIKSCVYCNAQFAITVEESSGEFSGRYELDHFYPKSKYPFLCTSFFNLQPCCSHCNKMKNNKQAEFNLYTDDFNQLDVFHFSIDKKSLLDYLLNQNEDDLKIILDCTDLNLKENHEKLFHISGIYEQHKDVVEEIIWRYKIYNESYKKSLADSFTKYFPNTNNLNRFVIGNYDKSSDIHKRPLSKLVQDIAKQLGII